MISDRRLEFLGGDTFSIDQVRGRFVNTEALLTA
jgi:hypothetical protein